MIRFSNIFVIVCLVAGISFAGSVKDAESTSLAVLVVHEPNAADFTYKLQPLIEAEASMQWPGRLVERTELRKILEELEISVSGMVESNQSDLADRLRLGRLVQMDCLLSVKVASDAVEATVMLFPSTAVIYERTYYKRLHPPALAVKIVTDTLKVFREHNRHPILPQTSIGSFFYTDPHRRFVEFSRDIGRQLRQQLVGTTNMVLYFFRNKSQQITALSNI